MDVFISRFLGSEDKETFFTRAQRSRMVYEILSATTFGREKKGEVKIIYTTSTFIYIIKYQYLIKSETKLFFRLASVD